MGHLSSFIQTEMEWPSILQSALMLWHLSIRGGKVLVVKVRSFCFLHVSCTASGMTVCVHLFCLLVSAGSDFV